MWRSGIAQGENRLQFDSLPASPTVAAHGAGDSTHWVEPLLAINLANHCSGDVLAELPLTPSELASQLVAKAMSTRGRP